MFFTAITFWEQLQQWDRRVFTVINRDGANSFLDAVMPFLRKAETWAPLYLFLLFFVLLNFKSKGAWWVVFLLVTVAITDMTGNYIFKQGFERLRPCNDPDFYGQVRLLLPSCGSGYSFISNHAANHFGIAAFFFLSFRHLLKKWAGVGFIWAAVVAYSQVYVGVHYPLDVIGGALLGLLCGTATGVIFNKRFGFAIFGNQ